MSPSQPVSGMTITLARMYPVETQAISSRLAPRFPIMSGSATLTIELSITCISAASTTANAIRYLWGAPSGDAEIGSASGSDSGPSSSCSSTVAAGIGYDRCKQRPNVPRSGILLSRVDAGLTGGCRVGGVEGLLHRFGAGNLRVGEDAVLLALAELGLLLVRIILGARGERESNHRDEQYSTFRHLTS